MQKATLEQLKRGSPDFPLGHYAFTFTKPRIGSRTHWHPEQEILYVTEGTLEVMVGKKVLLLESGQISFVPPNALHGVRSISESCSYHAFVFGYDLLRLPESHFFQREIIGPLEEGRLTLPLLLTPDAPIYREAVDALDILCRHKASQPERRAFSFQALIRLFTAMQPALEPAASTVDNQAVKLCMDYMQNRYSEKISLEQLAALVHLHPNYVCKLFREYTGQTVFQQLMQLRIENAIRLLEDEGCTVAQAAERCGFESISFFSRKFKELTGTSPQAYKKKHTHS